MGDRRLPVVGVRGRSVAGSARTGAGRSSARSERNGAARIAVPPQALRGGAHPAAGAAGCAAISRLRGDVHAAAVGSGDGSLGRRQPGQTAVPGLRSRPPAASAGAGRARVSRLLGQRRVRRLLLHAHGLRTSGRLGRVRRRVWKRAPELPSDRRQTVGARGWLSAGLSRAARRGGDRRQLCSANPRPTGDGGEDRPRAHLRHRPLCRRRHGVRARARGAGPGGRRRSGGGPAVSAERPLACRLPPEARLRADLHRDAGSHRRSVHLVRSGRLVGLPERPLPGDGRDARCLAGRDEDRGSADDRQVPRRRRGRLLHARDRPHQQHDSSGSAIRSGRTDRSSGTTRPPGWDTGGRIRRRCGKVSGRSSARRTRISTSPSRRGSSSSATRGSETVYGAPRSCRRPVIICSESTVQDSW